MHYLHRTDKPCMLLGCWSTHAIEYLGLVSVQRNIVLLCKRRIPESKRLALFKPLQITFLHRNIPTLWSSATLAPYWYCHVQMTRDHAKTHTIEVCILNVTQIRNRAETLTRCLSARVITLSRKQRIQLFATLGDELFCHDGRWTVCHARWCRWTLCHARWDKSVSGQNKAPFECGPWLIDRHFKSNEVYIYCTKRGHMYVQK